jgi:hypothetical protein
MFTDIVDSTDQAARLGDSRWRKVLDTALLHWRKVAPVSEGGGMIRRRSRSTLAVPRSAFAWFRFPPEIIVSP